MQAWNEFLKKQDEKLGSETVDKWLRSLKIVHFDAANLYLEAKDSFQALWFEEHVRSQLRLGLVNNNNRPIKVHLTASEVTAAKKGKKKEASPAAVVKPLFDFSSDPLDPNSTLERFVATGSNAIPYRLLCEWIAARHKGKEEAPLNPICLYGGAGVGKSHLLMGIATALKQAGLNPLYVRAETFTEHVVSAIRGGEMQEFRKAYRTVDALLIDDLHVFARRVATQEELFHTFNTLYTAKCPIILSSNCAPALLPDIEARLVSRFEWGITLPLQKPTNDELKVILKRRSEALNFPLHEELLEFLLATFSQNLHALHRSLDALVLRSHLDSKQRDAHLTLEKAKDYLHDLIGEEKQKALNSEKIIRTVAEYYGIRSGDILGKSQTQECALPRQIAMYLCRSKMNMPFMAIGRLFARDHSTVMTSVKQIEKKKEEHEVSSSLKEILKRMS